MALALVPGVPGRAMLERLIVMPLYLTPLLTAIGWSWLGSPRSGLINLCCAPRSVRTSRST